MEAALNAVRDRILVLATVGPGERVVDVGSGTGLLGLKALDLVGPKGMVIFLDISMPALSATLAQASSESAIFVAGDAVHCPIRDGWADVVVMRSVLIYIPDRRAAAREIARVLRPGGRLAFFEPINRRMEPVVDMTAFDDVAEAYARGKDINPLTNFEAPDLVSAFRDAGFASVDLEETESRWAARGREWAHGFKFGAPAGYSGYDMLLAGGLSPERADEFLAAGEQELGEDWRPMSCPAVYLTAFR
jgi:SAM-dependent methyltransferase